MFTEILRNNICSILSFLALSTTTKFLKTLKKEEKLRFEIVLFELKC